MESHTSHFLKEKDRQRRQKRWREEKRDVGREGGKAAVGQQDTGRRRSPESAQCPSPGEARPGFSCPKTTAEEPRWILPMEGIFQGNFE